MNSRERILLGLAVVGFVVPNTMVAIFCAQHGLDLGAYFSHWHESLPAAQLVADVALAGVAFAVWARWEARALEIQAWWIIFPAGLLVGVCFAVPLFLLMRERAQLKAAAA
jgi:hypothetical protein